MKTGIKGQRLIAAFLLGCLVFNYPVLSLFSSVEGTVWGVPTLFAYIFISWSCLIALVAVIVELPD